jgi:hypothetical protein
MAGKELIELPPAEMARFVAAAKPALDAYITDRASKGPVAEYEKYLIERVSTLGKKAPSEKECLDWADKNIVPFAPK